MKPQPKRCAVYTRKSSEEGLDQAFNSLDAQREAGEAYIKSQAAEGWKLVGTSYDDGGFSGGTMERPGLKALMADIAAQRIDVVVVYKIDRLTRSLADFARIVELFDQHQVSFVSVTQSFNTTSSMGRLTLNVLLSFAQFEREVTGERIRDKIAASKQKGMWMGGTVPLGYDLPGDASRALVVNEPEAATVRDIFARYLVLGSVHALERELAEQAITSKQWTTRLGKVRGGQPFSRGALFHLLRNRTYLGQIIHKENAYPGAHPPIVAADLFDQVQRQLDAARQRSASTQRTTARAGLTGRLFDRAGNPMSPTFSRGKSGRLYRYYVSAPLQQGERAGAASAALCRISATVIEPLIATLFGEEPDHVAMASAITRITLHPEHLEITLPKKYARQIASILPEADLQTSAGQINLMVPVMIGQRGGRCHIERKGKALARPDPVLIRALRRAHLLAPRDRQGIPHLDAAPTSPYQRKLVRLAFLAPDLQRDILAGRQPLSLTLEMLLNNPLPLSWDAQRIAFGGPESV